MAFTVEDFQDLIRLLEQRPEWRSELRRHVLSDELFELPSLVRQLVEAQRQAGERLDRIGSAIEQLVEAQRQTGQRLDRLEAAVERLVEAQGRTETRVGRIEGEVLELRYARRAPAYFSRLTRRLRVVDPGTLADLLDEAVATGRLTDEDRQAILDTDIVLTGRRREDGAEVYLLAEVSAGIGLHDVERAADRATMLEKLGQPVVPIVASGWINAQAAALAGERGVRHALNGRIAPPR
jgi:hypothetical protein